MYYVMSNCFTMNQWTNTSYFHTFCTCFKCWKICFVLLVIVIFITWYDCFFMLSVSFVKKRFQTLLFVSFVFFWYRINFLFLEFCQPIFLQNRSSFPSCCKFIVWIYAGLTNEFSFQNTFMTKYYTSNFVMEIIEILVAYKSFFFFKTFKIVILIYFSSYMRNINWSKTFLVADTKWVTWRLHQIKLICSLTTDCTKIGNVLWGNFAIWWIDCCTGFFQRTVRYIFFQQIVRIAFRWRTVCKIFFILQIVCRIIDTFQTICPVFLIGQIVCQKNFVWKTVCPIVFVWQIVWCIFSTLGTM